MRTECRNGVVLWVRPTFSSGPQLADMIMNILHIVLNYIIRKYNIRTLFLIRHVTMYLPDIVSITINKGVRSRYHNINIGRPVGRRRMKHPGYYTKSRNLQSLNFSSITTNVTAVFFLRTIFI